MTSLFRILFPDFDPGATVENAGVRPSPAPAIDMAEFDHELELLLDEGQKRAAKAEK